MMVVGYPTIPLLYQYIQPFHFYKMYENGKASFENKFLLRLVVNWQPFRESSAAQG
jgi:hypothetical protein